MAIPADLSPILSVVSEQGNVVLTDVQRVGEFREGVSDEQPVGLTDVACCRQSPSAKGQHQADQHCQGDSHRQEPDQPDDAAMRGTEQDVGSESARKVLTDLVVALAEGDTSSDICADVL